MHCVSTVTGCNLRGYKSLCGLREAIYGVSYASGGARQRRLTLLLSGAGGTADCCRKPAYCYSRCVRRLRCQPRLARLPAADCYAALPAQPALRHNATDS